MAPPPPWLSDDLISEILSRTPVKSVCRFRCVSCGWRALISDPAFVAAHRCPELLLVASFPHERPTREVEIKVMDMNGNVLRVIDRSGTYWTSLAAFDFDGSLYIDPSSGHVTDLATGHALVACPPELRKRVPYWFTIGRAAAPSCTYKAVRVTPGRPHAYMVLTLGEEEDAEWRPAPPTPSGASIKYSRRSDVVTLNGVMHFLLDRNKRPRPHKVGHGVLRFDLESETWKETIKGPPVAKPRDITTATAIRITNLNDALCTIVAQIPKLRDGGGNDRPRTDVWILSDDHGGGGGGGIWTKAYTIPMDPSFRCSTPLRVITRGSDGRKQLLFCRHLGRQHKMAPVLRVYDPLGDATGETCTEAATKLPCNLLGVLGLCCLHLKHAVPKLYLAT